MIAAPRNNLPKKAAIRRTAARELRRHQLITATIDCVARRGLADTTMAHVTRAAGLSLGIVNLHFESKEKLFVETLKYLADEYKQEWERALREGGASPAEKLVALIELDFKPRLCERKKLAVWFAFWGEAKSRPTYMKLFRKRDREYDAVLTDLCHQVKEEGGYEGIDPTVVAEGLAALTDGLWLDLLIPASSMTARRALKISMAYIARMFPDHFSAAD